MRGAIRHVVEERTRFKVCDEAGDGYSAIQKATDYCCDLVLLDIAMPHLDGVKTAAELRRTLPDTKIVGFSMVAKEVGERLVAQGTFDAFLTKFDGLTKLVRTLRSLLSARRRSNKPG